MAGQRDIYTWTCHQDVDIAQNNYKESKPLDLTTKAQNGVFSLQVEIESDSTSTSVTFTYYGSNDGVNFVAGDTAIASAVDVSSGLDKVYPFEPDLYKYILIRVTENDTGTVVDCTCTMAVQ